MIKLHSIEYQFHNIYSELKYLIYNSLKKVNKVAIRICMTGVKCGCRFYACKYGLVDRI